MAIFRDPCATQRLDWLLLQNGPLVLYWRSWVLQKDIEWFRVEGYRIDDLDCSVWCDASAFHASVKKALKFPDYYGQNLSAFADCISDLEVPDESGRVIVLHHFDSFLLRDRKVCECVLDQMAQASWCFLLLGLRLVTFLQIDNPDIPIRPVGAKSVQWNPAESLNKNHDASASESLVPPGPYEWPH